MATSIVWAWSQSNNSFWWFVRLVLGVFTSSWRCWGVTKDFEVVSWVECLEVVTETDDFEVECFELVAWVDLEVECSEVAGWVDVEVECLEVLAGVDECEVECLEVVV